MPICDFASSASQIGYNTRHSYKAPFVPLTPILGMGISFALMASLPLSTWLRLIVWLILGMGIYFGYGRKHSVLARAREAAK